MIKGTSGGVLLSEKNIMFLQEYCHGLSSDGVLLVE